MSSARRRVNLSEADKRRFLPYCHLPHTGRSGVSVALASVTLLPLRVLVILCCCVVAWLVAIATHDARVRFVCSRWLSRAIRTAFGFPRLTVRGAEHLRRDGVTVVCNHVSIIDIFILHELYAPAFVAKAGVKAIPFIGTIAAALGGIFVDRDVRRDDTKTTPSAAELISWRQTQHPFPTPDVAPLVVFAEGTTSNGCQVGLFHTGAFRSGCPVQPVCLDYRAGSDAFSPAFESIPTLAFLFSLLTQWRSSVTVTILPVRQPSASEIADPTLHAHAVQQAIASALQVPTTKTSLQDKLDLHAHIRASHFAWQNAYAVCSPFTESRAE
jgi:1-acyl-sn-glycerol-3-phosphate acyltransferase